jgi:hypothetical protein
MPFFISDISVSPAGDSRANPIPNNSQITITSEINCLQNNGELKTYRFTHSVTGGTIHPAFSESECQPDNTHPNSIRNSHTGILSINGGHGVVNIVITVTVQDMQTGEIDSGNCAAWVQV